MSGVRNATSFPQVMFIPMRMCHSFSRNSFLGLPKSRELYKDPRTYMCSDRGHVSSGQKPQFTPSTQCNGLPGTGLTSLGLRYPSLLLWVLPALLSSPQRVYEFTYALSSLGPDTSFEPVGVSGPAELSPTSAILDPWIQNIQSMDHQSSLPNLLGITL